MKIYTIFGEYRRVRKAIVTISVNLGFHKLLIVVGTLRVPSLMLLIVVGTLRVPSL